MPAIVVALWLLMLACLPASALAEAQRVRVLSYYNFLPWNDHDRAGLTPALARRLTELSAGRYRFVPQLLPRRRFDQELASSREPLVVAWANPGFLDDAQRRRYLWSPPLLKDVSLLVSRRERPVDFSGVESLAGLRFSAVSGHRYPDLEPLIAAGRLARVDAPDARLALMKLLFRPDSDFAFAELSLLGYLRRDPSFPIDQLHLSARPRLTSLTRHLMVRRRDAALFAELDALLRRLDCDSRWQATLREYGQEKLRVACAPAP
ncbi:amino acid ABC transporter substrate-binding protein (PAAT family) [Crenobacter luteus]|uniref:hypothetical protein n=1 Tax=Crenobacter luteus TaxID=1452487 RepID=UPI00104421E8|nr:hypothetical protein [Crenobacter luteus]TCP15172.1 amino acid ABC transporter substrate-binding protein (PAAT family) [Crenobacter luteus]